MLNDAPACQAPNIPPPERISAVKVWVCLQISQTGPDCTSSNNTGNSGLKEKMKSRVSHRLHASRRPRNSSSASDLYTKASSLVVPLIKFV